MTLTRLFAFGVLLPILVAVVSAVAADSGAPVATIGKQMISEQELDARTSKELKKLQDDYELSLTQLKLTYERKHQAILDQQLSAVIDERVLGLEAAARKSTPDALAEAVNPPAVTDQQMHAFYDAKKAQINQPFDAVAAQIKDYLTKQASETARRNYLDSLRTKYQAVSLLAPYRDQVSATGPQRGPSNARVTLVEFSDFQCPFCGLMAPVAREVLKKYPTQVRLIYRHFPLSDLHPSAEKAAEAAVCAENQGKFWEMHDLLFAEQGNLGNEALKEKAKRLGLDTAKFDQCFDSGKSAEIIRVDAAAGQALGIVGTPATFVNGRMVRGAATLGELSAVIDDELRRDALTARR